MREIAYSDIVKSVKDMILYSATNLPKDAYKALQDACVKSKAIYFGATGGAGALLARQIKSSEVVAYPELGPEAIRRLEVVDFPLTVINDTYGADLYKMGRAKYEVFE